MIKEICGVGPSGAGKDVALGRLQLLMGMPYVSLSDFVRQGATEVGMTEPTREDLQLFANQQREIHGNDVFARYAASYIDQNFRSEDFVIVNGVRHPSELQVFNNPLIIGVDSSPETRYERVKKRNRPSDPKTWEDFIECDIRENGTLDGCNGQQNYQCLEQADIILNNNGSLNNLDFAVDIIADDLVTLRRPLISGEIQLNYTEPSKKNILVLNGPHGAGKSTLGHKLEEVSNIKFLPEIGGQLREQVTYNSLQSGEKFDREVMRREILRDGQILRNKLTELYIVETWHTGNLAYAMQRSPKLANVYLDEYRKQLLKFQSIHILLLINDDNFIGRIKEKVTPAQYNDLLAFYKKITSSTRQIYDQFEIKPIEMINDGRLEDLIQGVLNCIDEM